MRAHARGFVGVFVCARLCVCVRARVCVSLPFVDLVDPGLVPAPAAARRGFGTVTRNTNIDGHTIAIAEPARPRRSAYHQPRCAY